MATALTRDEQRDLAERVSQSLARWQQRARTEGVSCLFALTCQRPLVDGGMWLYQSQGEGEMPLCFGCLERVLAGDEPGAEWPRAVQLLPADWQGYGGMSPAAWEDNCSLCGQLKMEQWDLREGDRCVECEVWLGDWVAMREREFRRE